MPVIKVPRESGEQARVFLSSLSILDSSKKIFADSQSVHIGALRRLSASEEDGLKNICPFSYSKKNLPAGKEKKTLESQLSSKLSPAELSLVKNSFDIIGGIAVLQVPPGLEGKERIIARALMDVHRNIKTVCKKTGIVSGEFRILPVEILLGENRLETVHREYSCSYRLDISRVFFTPRLATERMRIASQCKPKETIVDMFAGVGPFSILIAKKSGARVFAIDLNGDAHKYLAENVRLNKLEGKVTPILGDAKKVCSTKLKNTADRIIMNLPKHAFGFFPAALKCLKQKGIIHYHFFAREGDKAAHIEKLKILAGKKGAGFKVLALKRVRQIAPREWNWAADLRVKKVTKKGRGAIRAGAGQLSH